MRIRAVRFAVGTLSLMLGASCSTPAREVVPPQPNRARDRSVAKAIVLTKRDFPKGWTGRRDAAAKSKVGEKLDREFAACIGTNDPANTHVVTFSGATFSDGAAEVDSDVAFVRTEADALSDFAAIGGGKADPCLRRLFRRELNPVLKKDGVLLRSLSVRTLNLPRIGDGTIAKRLTITATGAARTVKLYLDLVAILKKRAEITVSFMGIGQPFDPAMQRRLLKRIERRVDLV